MAVNAGGKETGQGRATGPLCFPGRLTKDHPKTGGDNRMASKTRKRKQKANVR
jgi:hypothetical protein